MLTAADLAAYSPQWTEPLHTTYRGHDVYSNPATSRGGFEVLMRRQPGRGLRLEGVRAAGSPAALHAMIEAIKIPRPTSTSYVADPAFVTVPTAGLLSREFTARTARAVRPAKAIAYPAARRARGPADALARRLRARPSTSAYDPEQHTTSFSMLDRFGNAVGVTPTLGGLFGSNVVVGNTGLLLNNGMRLGSTSPYPTDANYVGAGKIPILNNSPVIVLKDGKLAYRLRFAWR